MPNNQVVQLYAGITLHAMQRAIYDSKARFKVAACGRRSGKSVLSEVLLSEPAGNGFPVAYFAPTYKLLEERWESLLNIWKPAIESKSEQMHVMKLKTGGSIECWSLENPQSGLGRRYKRVVVDEAATGEYKTMWERTVRPTLTDYSGDAFFFSTPRGMNWFFDFYQRGIPENRELWGGEWESFHFPTSTNPYLPKGEVESARRELPAQIFAQEYEAAFISESDAVFRNLERCWFAVAQEKAISGHSYFISWDVARVNDFSAMAVIDATIHEMVKIDVSVDIAFEQQIGRLWALIEAFNPIGIVIEDNGNAKLIEDLNKRGWPVVPFHTSMVSKMILVDALALAFEREAIQILKDDALIGELQAYRHQALPGGGIRYSAPEGRHDDRVMALMLANWASSEEYAGEADYIRIG